TQHPEKPTWRAVMFRRPLFLLATSGAVAAIAAGAIAVSTGVLSGTPTGENRVAVGSSSTGASGETGASPAATRMDARSFLLAVAQTVQREPATTGEYWYVRTREASPTRHLPEEYAAEVKRLVVEAAAECRRTGCKEIKLDSIGWRYSKKLEELRKKFWPDGYPYTALLVQTVERWRPKREGGTSREKASELELVFPTPEDEAKWKEHGSPNLLPDGKVRPYADSDIQEPLSVNMPDLTMENVGELPTSKEELADLLRQRYERQADKDKAFPVFLWDTAVELMTAPTMPGTRAALLQVLADQPGITSEEAQDAGGRTGVALTVKEAEGVEFTMIIDKDSAELLEYAVNTNNGDCNVFRVTFEDFGWTDRLGERPQG